MVPPYRKHENYSPCSIISTRDFKCGNIAQPMRMAICCTILMPVWRACQDFFDRHTAFKNGRREGIPTNKYLVVIRYFLKWLDGGGHHRPWTSAIPEMQNLPCPRLTKYCIKVHLVLSTIKKVPSGWPWRSWFLLGADVKILIACICFLLNHKGVCWFADEPHNGRWSSTPTVICPCVGILDLKIPVPVRVLVLTTV